MGYHNSKHQFEKCSASVMNKIYTEDIYILVSYFGLVAYTISEYIL